jgi:hypothetical protein
MADKHDPAGESAGEPGNEGNIARQLTSPRDIDERFVELESKLIEQDHRWVGVFVSLYSTYSRLPSGDPRRSAAVRALVWRIFSPATIAAGAIGLISLLGLLVALHANYLLALQNERLDQQTLLLEAQRRSGLVTEFTSLVEQIQSEREKLAANENPQATQLKLSEPTIGRVVALSRSYRPYLFLEIAGEADELLIADVAPSKDLRRDESALSRFVNYAIGSPTVGDAERPRMTKIALSPERGQLLIALVSAQIELASIAEKSADFTRSDLRRANLSSADLRNFLLTRSSFVAADLLSADLSGAFLGGADFSRACLSGVKIDGAMLDGANFEDTRLDGAFISDPRLFSGVQLKDADLKGLLVTTKGWLDEVSKLANPPKDFHPEKWKIGDTIKDTTAGFPVLYQIVPAVEQPANKSIC